jgi:spermidine synthase
LRGFRAPQVFFTENILQTTRKSLIYLLFVLSGATSLIYQSVWVRLLSLSVGSTSASISLVLAIFFFGLALGSYLAGSLSSKIKKPILAYGIIEGLIGLYSVGLVHVFLNLHLILTYLPHQGSMGWVGDVTKYILVALLLLPPTVGMGASLPILVRVFQDSKASVGRKVSVLYFINTLGAVFGAFGGSFLLIPQWGVVTSNHLSAAGNLFILVLAFFLESGTSNTTTDHDSKETGRTKTYFGLWRQLSGTELAILFVAFSTGFSSIAAEVVWNKYLGIFFGTNIYGLGIILSIFLAGIAFGSLAMSLVVDRIKAKKGLFLFLLSLAVLALIATSHAFNYLPLAANVAGYYMGGSVNLLTIKSVLSALLIFPPTLIFGGLFPLLVDLLTARDKEAPAVVGLAYAVNTVGAITGSYIGGMLIIPVFGSSAAVSVSAGVLAVSCATAFLALNGRSHVARFCALLVLCAAGASAVHGSIDFRNILKSAYFQQLQPSLSFSEVTKYFARDYEEFALIREGKTAIISLSQDPKDGPQYKDYFRLKTNGLNESIYYKKNLQMVPKYEGLLGMLPYAMSAKPEKAFVVGFGGGYTVGLLTMLDIPNVHVAELEEGIIDAAQYVYDGDNPILKRPNLKLTLEDARFILATKQGGPYDIIVSQPSHSWLSGVANLFTREFFEIVRGNLTEGGIFSQWLNLYNMDEKVLKSIMRTFFEVFPHGFVFTDHRDEELIMIGSVSPVNLDITRLKAWTQNPELAEALINLPFSSPEDFVSNFATTRDNVMNATEGSPINTDINAYAEVNQSALFYAAGAVAGKPQAYLSTIYSGELEKVAGNFTDGVKRFFSETLSSLLKQAKFFKFAAIYEVFQTKIDSSVDDLISAGYLAMQAQRYATARFYFAQAMQQQPDGRGLDYMLGTMVETHRWKDGVDLFLAHKKSAGTYARCYFTEALIESGNQNYAKLSKEYPADTTECGAYGTKVAGKMQQQAGNYAAAIQHFEDFYAQYPQDVNVLERLTSLHLLAGDRERGREFAGYLAQTVKDRAAQLQSLADYYRERGYQEDAYILQSLPR